MAVTKKAVAKKVTKRVSKRTETIYAILKTSWFGLRQRPLTVAFESEDEVRGYVSELNDDAPIGTRYNVVESTVVH